jgi:hypothetical protein
MATSARASYVPGAASRMTMASIDEGSRYKAVSSTYSFDST